MSLVGRLEDLALPDIFQILSLGRKSGCLVVTVEEGTAGIIFENGLVVRCECDFLDSTLGNDIVCPLTSSRDRATTSNKPFTIVFAITLDILPSAI